MSAETIKAKIIDWFLDHYNDIIIGNEVMYGSKRKVADLIIINNNRITAVEIKSESDNLNRLQEQINEYERIFDKTIIVSSPSHIGPIKALCNKRIGIYALNQNVDIIQVPRQNNNQDKLEMLYSISSAFLEKEYPQFKKLNSDEIRHKLSQRSKQRIHQLMISFYKSRYSDRFTLFLSERGEQTLVDDIPVLSSFFQID